jgi:hypothetical protein
MTVSLKHTFQSAKTDSADATIIQPSNWNQEHVLTAAAGKVLGRDTSGAGNVQELPISVTSAGNVTIPNNFAVTGTTGLTGTTTLVDLTSTGTASLTNLGVTGTTTLTNALTVPNGGTGAATLTANNVLLGNGTSAVQTVAPGTAGNALLSNGTSWVSGAVLSAPSFDAIATGSLANGSTVIVNADGTVSVVAGQNENLGTPVVFRSSSTNSYSAVYDSVNQKVIIAYGNNTASGLAIVGTVSGTSISFGTATTFVSLLNFRPSIVYDSVNQKVVIAFVDAVSGAQDNLGTARVGTVSGTSISFGTAVVFNNASTSDVSAAYDANAQKIVIAYRNVPNSGRGTAIVGTVSGTSISFGTAVVFENGSTNNTFTTYDANAQKVVIAYSNTGTATGVAIVGTVSGTSISFGTAVVFESTSTASISAVYHVNAQKVVVAYADGGNSSFGTAIVGTVSGTSISFGTAVVFESAGTGDTSATYDSVNQKIVIAYRDAGNSSFGTAIVGTVSGTSISFATPFVFESASTEGISAVYDTNTQKIVVAYKDGGNSSFATAAVFQYLLTNLTTENFIGFSNGAYTNGQTATIQIVGAVDDAQGSLTPGQQYFVQANGSLGLTAGTPSVFAGTAVATTKIIVKG